LGRVAAELQAAFLHVGAGDIQFVASQSLGVLKDPNHLDVIFEGIAKDVSDDRCIEFSQYREFFSYKGPNAHVLEADGIQQPGSGGVQAWRRGTLDGLPGKALGDKAAEAVQVDDVGVFKAVTEGAAGGENRIPQAQRANFYAEVNRTCGSHFGWKDTTGQLWG